MPKTDLKRKRARQSIVFFVHFDHEAWINPLSHLKPHPINKNKVYEKVQSFEHVEKKLNQSRN